MIVHAFIMMFISTFSTTAVTNKNILISTRNNYLIYYLLIGLLISFFRSVKAQENETHKKTPKKSSGRMKIGQVFKKTPTKDNGNNLFGVPLSRICEGEILPKPVMVSVHLNINTNWSIDLL